MENIELKEINLQEFEKSMYSYYEAIFPDDERKPLSVIRKIYEKGYTQILGIYNGNFSVGFMMINRIERYGYAILDYLAIFEEYRNKGYGTKAVESLKEMYKDAKGIFVEVDKVGLGIDEEENKIREKRKNFYENLGFKKLNYDLYLFDVMYMPYLYSNIEIDEEIVVEKILDIYNATVRKERISRNCKFIKL